MNLLTHGVLLDASPNIVGEYLRLLTFSKHDDTKWSFGCYTNFEVRDDAIQNNDLAEMFFSRFDEDTDEEDYHGWLYPLGDYVIGCFWYWAGDGDLAFVVYHNGHILRVLRNMDCKKDHGWEDVPLDAFV